MGKVIFWVFAGLLGLVILGSLVGKDESTRNPDERSVGYLSPGECMSAEKYNWAASIVVKNTDWSQMEESAAYSAGTKSLIGGITVFKEMARLGTRACPDLAPLYNQYLASQSSTAAVAKPAPSQVAAPSPPATSQKRATLTTGANVRSGPSTSSSVVQVANKGDTFNVFDARDGWVQVGAEKAEGWVAASLLKQ